MIITALLLLLVLLFLLTIILLDSFLNYTSNKLSNSGKLKLTNKLNIICDKLIYILDKVTLIHIYIICIIIIVAGMVIQVLKYFFIA